MGKKVTGRKRHLVVDTLELLLALFVHAADIQDRDGAKQVWADGGYARKLIEWVYAASGWLLAKPGFK